MSPKTLETAVELAGLLFRLGEAALARSDSKAARQIAALGSTVIGAAQTAGRIDAAIAKRVRALAATLDADGLPDRPAWEGLADDVERAVARWQAAG